MILAIFGATGATGKQLVEQALEKGHIVRALVRDPQKITKTNRNLMVIPGNVLDKKDVENTVKNADAVISVLGTKLGEKRLILRDGTENIVTAMKKQGLKRLLVQSSYSFSGDTRDMSIALKLVATLLKLFFRKMVEDKMAQEKLVRESGLDWTIIRPVTLTEDEYTGKYRVGEKIQVGIQNKISRADVAGYLLTILKEVKTLGKTLVISN